jgi:hypothetical protein
MVMAIKILEAQFDLGALVGRMYRGLKFGGIRKALRQRPDHHIHAASR